MLTGKTIEEKIWNYLISKGLNSYGTAGLMGNLYAESGLKTNNLENLCEKRLAENGKSYCTDEKYTAAVDNNTISRSEFLNPLPGKQYGYGLAQWTSPGRKAGLYDLVKSRQVSISDLETQLDFLMKELKTSYTSVLSVLKTAKSVKTASDIVLKKFECPANSGTAVQNTRAKYGQAYYDKYATKICTTGETNMTVSDIIENATKWMENMANDNSHGYDQIYRWGEKGDYDCSSAVITAWEQTGVKVKTAGATYTGNMLPVFKSKGFIDVTNKINLSTGAGLIRGDVLLNTTHHTAMYCGNGKEVEASINERGSATGGTPGDQTGKEFLIRSYRNYPWTHVLRYTGNSSSTIVATSSILRKGSTGSAVKTLQNNLNKLIGAGLVVDGSFGTNTYNAVVSFQKKYGLDTDGEVGNQTQSKISELLKAQTTTSNVQLKIDAAQSFSKSVAGTYKTTADLNLRTGAGTNNNKQFVQCVIPSGGNVICYGYYTSVKDTKWLYVVYQNYTGFVSSKYLKKV